MQSLYVWPDHPAASIVVLWLASVVLLWAARQPMLALLAGLGTSLEEGLDGLARWCRASAQEVRKRARVGLLAAGRLELQSKQEREFHRIDAAFSRRLEQYSELHRELDDAIGQLHADYQNSGDNPPEVPGWTQVVQSIAAIPANGDANVDRLLADAHRSLEASTKKALKAYREDSSARHRILNAMAPVWKEVRNLLERMHECVSRALETATRVNRYVDDYEQIRKDEHAAARAMSYSAVKLFTVSLLVLLVALGGAFVNFQLIALPMSELVPAGARLGGVPVSTISALVIVLLEITVGLFVMDMLGITELFPRLSAIPASRRRLILLVGLAGLFLLASVEASLAVLREMIAEADAALKLALAGASEPIGRAGASRIPVLGQAVLGFVLPWILALVAVPLEMLIDSGRHVAAMLGGHALAGIGHAAAALAHLARTLSRLLPSAYDVYVAIPLRIEQAIGRGAGRSAAAGRSPAERERVVREGSTA
jgi:hypothetical protein